VTVELKWDGKKLTGTVNPGPNAVELLKTSFNPKTGAVHFEADTKDRRGNPIHYVIDGKVEKGTMTGNWSHENRKGDFKITRKQVIAGVVQQIRRIQMRICPMV